MSRSCLPFGFEACDDLPRVDARLEELDRDLAAHRTLLLGQKDQAEAAFADLLDQLVGPQQRPRLFHHGVGNGRQQCRGNGQEARLFVMNLEQCRHPARKAASVPHAYAR